MDGNWKLQIEDRQFSFFNLQFPFSSLAGAGPINRPLVLSPPRLRLGYPRACEHAKVKCPNAIHLCMFSLGGAIISRKRQHPEGVWGEPRRGVGRWRLRLMFSAFIHLSAQSQNALVLCHSLILELFHRSGDILPPFSAAESRRYEERSIPIFSCDKALAVLKLFIRASTEHGKPKEFPTRGIGRL
jgi:hypothetical protein